jgi:hypothetical protein
MQQNVISHYLIFDEVKIMFGNFSEQMKKSTKPASALLEMNAKALELVSQQQTIFFSGLMSDSVKLLSSLNDQTDLKSVVAAQSVYAQSLKDRLASASTTTYSALNEMREDLTSVVKTNFVDVVEEAKPASPAPASPTVVKTQVATPTKVVKQASTKKATEESVKAPAEVKKEVAPVAKQEKAAQPQATPPVVSKPNTSKAPAKKTVAKKTPAAKKVAVASAADKMPAVAKKPTVKKSVAELSPADVKADSSKKA